MSIRHAVDPVEALAGILTLIDRELDYRCQPLVCCDACGCLCHPCEVCPSCHPGGKTR